MHFEARPSNHTTSHDRTSGAAAVRRFHHVALASMLALVLCQCRARSTNDDSPAVPEIASSATTAIATTAAASREPSDASICESMCEHSRSLACAAASRCAESCAALLEEQACREPLLRALRCMVAEPRSRWSCGEEGLASIESGLCDAEQGAFVGCLQKG